MTTAEKIALISSIIAVMAALISVVSTTIARLNFLLNKKVYEDAHDQRRRELAISLSAQFDEQTLDARAEILSRWKTRFDKSQAIPWTEIEKVRDEQINARNATTKHDLVVTDQLAKILNFFEVIASAVLGGVADEELLKDVFSATTTRWHILSREYRQHLQDARGYNPWLPLDTLVLRWNSQTVCERPTLGKTK